MPTVDLVVQGQELAGYIGKFGKRPTYRQITTSAGRAWDLGDFSYEVTDQSDYNSSGSWTVSNRLLWRIRGPEEPPLRALYDIEDDLLPGREITQGGQWIREYNPFPGIRYRYEKLAALVEKMTGGSLVDP